MKVIFIKNHPIGIAEGTITEVQPKTAEKWIEEGFAKKIDSEDKPKKESKKKGSKK